VEEEEEVEVGGVEEELVIEIIVWILRAKRAVSPLSRHRGRRSVRESKKRSTGSFNRHTNSTAWRGEG